ncbi:GntR family transcriptional regulator [Microbacterium sp. SSM24]|uniref:GntR family transcriptional regulator n=1 Tax=Microbacterium sp. SSM24 TaxID=2991714 RepID=UPI002226C2BE|nr:GntR family transcriptional regulator [Microbacterium sp. SSM24]MCW3492936.1 GntR family transcriptional regulator [Microbacterium sp. SSM24]
MTTPLAPLVPSGAVLGDEVYARLGEAILDGTLAPGERLRDHELAEWLGVSRTPVREALQRLERVGLVEVSPHRYTRVSTPNDKAQADTLEFVAYLMGNAARMASTNATDEVLEDAIRELDAVIAASRFDDYAEMLRTSHIFFAKLTRATGNVAILRFMREAELAIRRNISTWRPIIECPVGRTTAYEGFREAMRERDGVRAEALLRQLHGLT